jgi:hypothetical protein
MAALSGVIVKWKGGFVNQDRPVFRFLDTIAFRFKRWYDITLRDGSAVCRVIEYEGQ